MAGRLAHGSELLRFFVNHNYVIIDDEFGQVILCHRDEKDSLYNPINIPNNQPIPSKLLRHILAQGGFTEDKFWGEVE